MEQSSEALSRGRDSKVLIVVIAIMAAIVVGLIALGGIRAYQHHRAVELSSCEFGWAFQGKDPVTAELLCKQGIKP